MMDKRLLPLHPLPIWGCNKNGMVGASAQQLPGQGLKIFNILCIVGSWGEIVLMPSEGFALKSNLNQISPPAIHGFFVFCFKFLCLFHISVIFVFPWGGKGRSRLSSLTRVLKLLANSLLYLHVLLTPSASSNIAIKCQKCNGREIRYLETKPIQRGLAAVYISLSCCLS